MPNAKKALLSLVVAAVILCTVVSGQAAADKNKKPPTKVPIEVEADEIYFSDLTGDMFAKGKVALTQGDVKVLGELIRGNAKKNEIWVDDNATFLQPGTKLVGTGVRYNYGARTGTMKKVVGKVDRELVSGQNVELFPKELIVHDGTLTGCPAKVPDYHVSASKVEIWPGEKLIAYNAKFWIKDKVIFTMAKYQKSLRDSQSEFPQVGYTSQDGFFIRQHLEYPLGDSIAAFGDVVYYTHAKFKPVYGLVAREANYKVTLEQGHYRDTNDNWIQKAPELRVDFYSHQLGALPVKYTFYGVYGKWEDKTKSSWHQEYNLYLTGNPIKLGDTMALYLGTGVQHIRESFDGSARTTVKYDATLGKTWSPRLYTWLGYHHTQNNDALFAYGRADLARQFDAGFTYKIDKMNSIGFLQTYDVTNHKIFDQDYTWYRNLHCWQAAITYRAKRSQLVLDLSTTRF